MNVAIVAAEVVPFSKSGGLGDVTGALADALAARGHRVATVSPLYASVDRSRLEETDHTVVVSLAAALHVGRIWRTTSGPVEHLFVASPMFDRDGLYGDRNGSFGDNHLRFAFLCEAALHAIRTVPLRNGAPMGEDVVFHVHDWHTALLPVLLQARWRPVGLYRRAATVLTVHNPAHAGRLPAALFNDLELPTPWFSPGGLEWHGDLGILKAGLLHADLVTTVSPTFADETRTVDGGFGLDAIFTGLGDRYVGVLNGIDIEAWNPRSDPALTLSGDPASVEFRSANKSALQRELGLPVDDSIPLVGSVGRLDPQKGVEMLLESIPWLVMAGAQVIVLGSAAAAHQVYEHRLRELEWRYPSSVRGWIGFNEGVAHRIPAGADVFAMPSVFEPCGLAQMVALRYGCVPVVRSTGGLCDTVVDVDDDPKAGTGYRFSAPAGHALRGALWRAISRRASDPKGWADIVARGVATNPSWGPAAATYEGLMLRALARRSS